MDIQVKQKWIDALRSGEYNQTHQVLHDEHGYCCLGVLCVVAGIPITDDGEHCADENGNSERYRPIDRLLLEDKWHSAKFVKMNDIEHKSFAEIADYIEANF